MRVCIIVDSCCQEACVIVTFISAVPRDPLEANSFTELLFFTVVFHIYIDIYIEVSIFWLTVARVAAFESMKKTVCEICRNIA